MTPWEAMNATSCSFVHKRLIGAVGGFLGGGPAGAVSGFFGTSGGGRGFVPSSTSGSTPFRSGRTLPVSPVAGLRGFSQRAIPGGATGLQVAFPTGTGCPSGWHPNKSDYTTLNGFVARGTRCVKNRRRNRSNGRANTRAVSRMAAWDKQERKLAKTLKAIASRR